MFEDMDVMNLANTYVIPWGVNLALALAVFVIGRLVARMLAGVLVKFLHKSGMDEILINFVASIVRTLLLLVVVIASLNQLGVDTTSLIALIGAAGLAVGLALQNSLQNFAESGRLFPH